jgi:hypothetical protein
MLPALSSVTTADLAGKAPRFVIPRGDWLVTGNESGRVCRVNLVTRHAQCEDFPSLTAVNLAVGGLVYLTIDHHVQAWALDGTRTALLPDVRVEELQWTGGSMVAITIDGVAVLDATPRMIATPKISRVRVLDRDRIAATTTEDSLIVIDLIAGSSYRAGTAPPNWQLFSGGNSVIFMNGPWYELALPVPTEPVALRAWLATVTNARVVADSDVVQWP